MTRLRHLLMIGIEGTELSTETRDWLVEYEPAGVILFRRNIQHRDQLRHLITQLQTVAKGRLMIGVDHEGGRVFRLPPPFTTIPPMMTLAKNAGDRAEAVIGELGRSMASELMSVGFNLNFAPVMDVHTNPDNPIIGDRAFSSDPAVVATLGTALIRGLQSSGVAACAKHFPGHGDTSVDSHLDLPVLDHSIGRLRDIELVPFEAAIRAGVAAIMPGHLLCAGVDKYSPVTFSKKIITSLLRHEMGYDGVIITDDLCMNGVAAYASRADCLRRSLLAGCDILLTCHKTSEWLPEVIALEREWEGHPEWRRRIDESYNRIEALRAKWAKKPDINQN